MADNNAKAVVDQLRMMAKQVASGAINPTGSAEHDRWGEPGGAEGFTWSFDAQHGGVRDDAISGNVSAQLNDLADKIESGALEPIEREQKAHIDEMATSNWAGVNEENPTGFTYTVVLMRK